MKRLLLHAINEALDDPVVYVGLEQGYANLAQGRLQMGFADATLPAKFPKYPAQLLRESFKHRDPRGKKYKKVKYNFG
jgi:hypothetical protein